MKSTILLLVVAAVSLQNVNAGIAECQGSFLYLLEADTGGYYGRDSYGKPKVALNFSRMGYIVA